MPVNPEAEAAYVKAHATAKELLEKISNILEDMPAPGNDAHPINWAHVGDVHHINYVLRTLTDTD